MRGAPPAVFGTGDVRVEIVPNRDIALFVNRGERMAGRLTRRSGGR